MTKTRLFEAGWATKRYGQGSIAEEAEASVCRLLDTALARPGEQILVVERKEAPLAYRASMDPNAPYTLPALDSLVLVERLGLGFSTPHDDICGVLNEQGIPCFLSEPHVVLEPIPDVLLTRSQYDRWKDDQEIVDPRFKIPDWRRARAVPMVVDEHLPMSWMREIGLHYGKYQTYTRPSSDPIGRTFLMLEIVIGNEPVVQWFQARQRCEWYTALAETLFSEVQQRIQVGEQPNTDTTEVAK